MIKTYLRKPLYIILYLVLVFMGFLALAKVGENIRKDKKEYKYIYENTEIRGEIVEANSLSGSNTLKFDDLFFLFTMDELGEIYSRTFTKTFMDEDKEKSVDVFASNDIKKLIKRNFVTYDKDPKLKKGEALVSDKLLDKLGLKKNDYIRLFLDDEGLDGMKARYVDFLVKDSMGLEDSVLGEDSVIITNQTFFDDGFLQNEYLWQSYGYFVGLSFVVDPSFNKDFEKIKEKIDKRLDGKYLAPTNSRDFYNVIKPLEEKIGEEERLIVVLKLGLIILSSLILVLKIRQEKIAILIRKIFGEAEFKVFTKVFISLGLVVLFINVFSLMVINLLTYISLDDILINLLINLFVLAFVTFIICKKDTFILYQKMED